MTKHVLHLPEFTPVSLNVLMKGVRSRIRQKRGDREIVAYEAGQQNIRKANGRRRVSLFVILAKGQKVLDEDNAWKSILDALVCAGLLVDDSGKWVERGSVRWSRSHLGLYRETFVVLEDV